MLHVWRRERGAGRRLLIVVALALVALVTAGPWTSPARADKPGQDKPKFVPASGSTTPAGSATTADDKNDAGEKPKTGAAPDASPAPVTKPTEQPAAAPTAKPGAPAAGGHDKGLCGDADPLKVEPSTDEPAPGPGEPRMVLSQRVIEGEPVWQGKQAEFSWDVTNTGQGELTIRVKGG